MNQEIEIWRDVEGFEGIYRVSSLGFVKSMSRIKKRSDGKIQTFKERLLSLVTRSNDGYVVVKITKNGIGRMTLVHRLVCEAFLDNPDNKRTVNHKNGIKTDNRLCNLEWATHGENLEHALHTGLRIPLFGEKSPASKLTELEVFSILGKFESGISKASIAREFGVSFNTIRCVVTGVTWKSVSL